MASYAQFMGRKVTVSYRVGDVLIPASGTFVADSGRSIFLEQHLEQRGRMSYFRWEIPYPYIHRIAEAPETEEASATGAPSATAAATSEEKTESSGTSSARAAAASGGSPLLPLSHRPKTA
jgi:hypothetical protein